MFRTAVILLALALAACASEQARNPAAKYTSGWNPDAAVTISCAEPGPKPRTIRVPAGRNPVDFCSATAITYHTPFHLPVSNDAAAPSDEAVIQRDQDKRADEELRALALRNKTAGQQTSGQPP